MLLLSPKSYFTFLAAMTTTLLTFSAVVSAFPDYDTSYAFRLYHKDMTCTSQFVQGESGDNANAYFYRSPGGKGEWQIVDTGTTSLGNGDGNPIVYIKNVYQNNYLSASDNQVDVVMSSDAGDLEEFEMFYYGAEVTINSILGSDNVDPMLAFKSVELGTYLSGDGCGDIKQATVVNDVLSDYEYWTLLDYFSGGWGSNEHGGKVGSMKYHKQVYDADSDTWLDTTDEYCLEVHGNSFGYDKNDFKEYMSYSSTERIVLSDSNDPYATSGSGCRPRYRTDIGSGDCGSPYHAPYPYKYFSCGTSDCMTFSNAEYTQDAVAAFCDAFEDGDKCCTSDDAGTTFDFWTCSDEYGGPDSITMCRGACQGHGSCNQIGTESVGHAITFEVDSCNGQYSCNQVAQLVGFSGGDQVELITFGEGSCRGSSACLTMGAFKAREIEVAAGSCVGELACSTLGVMTAEAITIDEDCCLGIFSCRGVGYQNADDVLVTNAQCTTVSECDGCGEHSSGSFILDDSATDC